MVPCSLTALAHTPENCTLCKNGDIARPDTYDSEYERVTTRRKRGEGKGKKKKVKERSQRRHEITRLKHGRRWLYTFEVEVTVILSHRDVSSSNRTRDE